MGRVEVVALTPGDLFEADAGLQRRFDRRALLAVGLLLVAIALGVFFVLRFGAAEAERDLRAWQDRLGIVAESRLQAVEGWLAAQYNALEELASNTSLVLYMTELALADGDYDGVSDEPAERSYLRNLLVATADHAGFSGPISGPDLNVSVEREGSAGIALLDATGKVLVATPGMPALGPRVAAALRETPKGRPGFIDLYAGLGGAPTIGFLEPVFALQSDGGADSVIGYVVGIRLVAAQLFPLLKQPGATEPSAEALLVRREGNVVRLLSPTADGAAAFSRTIALDTPELAEAFALETPGGFAIKRDYRDAEVLLTARAVKGAPWTLLYKVDRADALADSVSRRQRLLIAFFLIIGVVSAALVAVWFHASSRRAGEAATRYRALAERFERQERFLALVTDSQPNDIAVIDERGTVRYGNRRLAESVRLSAGDLVGKALAALFGPIAARRIEALNRAALQSSSPVSETHQVEIEGTLRTVQSVHVPLHETLGLPRSVLLVNEDITAAVTEREKRARILRDLVGTLVGVVDRRDPYSAHHSTRVADVSRAIAEEMTLEPALIETVEVAGSLMNLGKIFIPSELLTANRALSEEERRLVTHSVLTSAELLEGVSFEGPVVETLRQLLEHIDGSGQPNGLKGDAILKTARICAVANAFVGMVSARAYRASLEFDQAIDLLLKDSGKRFDRSVVAALVNRLDNHGGRQRWAEFRTPPRPPAT
jgi:PAS domain S-box-containing protein